MPDVLWSDCFPAGYGKMPVLSLQSPLRSPLLFPSRFQVRFRPARPCVPAARILPCARQGFAGGKTAPKKWGKKQGCDTFGVTFTPPARGHVRVGKIVTKNAFVALGVTFAVALAGCVAFAGWSRRAAALSTSRGGCPAIARPAPRPPICRPGSRPRASRCAARGHSGRCRGRSDRGRTRPG